MLIKFKTIEPIRIFKGSLTNSETKKRKLKKQFIVQYLFDV